MSVQYGQLSDENGHMPHVHLPYTMQELKSYIIHSTQVRISPKVYFSKKPHPARYGLVQQNTSNHHEHRNQHMTSNKTCKYNYHRVVEINLPSLVVRRQLVCHCSCSCRVDDSSLFVTDKLRVDDSSSFVIDELISFLIVLCTWPWNS